MSRPVDGETTAWLWPLLRPHRVAVIQGSTAVLMSTGATLTMPYLFKLALDHGIRPGGGSALAIICLAYLAAVGGRYWTARAAALTVASVSQRVLYAIRRLVFDHVQRLPLSFHQNRRVGGVVALLTGDVDAAAGLVSSGAVELATSLIIFFGVAILLIVLDGTLALQTLAVTPLFCALIAWFRRRFAPATRRLRDASSSATEELHELVNSVPEIQNYRQERSVLARLARRNEAVRDLSRLTSVLSGVFFPGIELISVVAMVVVVVFGGPRVLTGHLGIGTLAAFLLYLQTLFGPIFGLSQLYSTLQSAMAGARRIGVVLAQRPTVTDPEHPVRLPSPRGAVQLRNVHFAYPTVDGTTGVEVLHDVNIDIPAGTTLGLVGATGAGKSTIAGLILRYHDPRRGTVTLDGVDLRDIGVSDLRASASFVPQDGFLFSGTVADNIGLGRPQANREAIEHAVSELGLDTLLHRLPAGLDTEVGERGKLLANGERQAIALLRAWMADPAVLVLDEATGQLDPRTEALVHTALRRLRHGRTTVVIAHQLASVIDSDQIAVVARGRVVESGTFHELVNAKGHFAQMHEKWVRSAEHEPAGQ